MRRIRAELVQSVTPPFAWRVRLPTYTMIRADYANGRAVVEIPDDDFPDTDDVPGGPGYVDDDGVPMLVRLSALRRAAWHARLRQRYRSALAPMDASIL